MTSSRRQPLPPPPRPRAPRSTRRRSYRQFQPPPEADTILLPDLRQDSRFPVRPDTGVLERAQPGRPRPGGRHSAPATGSQRPAPASPRRAWVSRAVLLVILGMQAVISLRLDSTASGDEARSLYSGHMEWGHLLHGTALQGDYPSYFSGAPVLYPLLGALADTAGGLAAARAVSLAAMLATTALLYMLTRRLFNERVGLCAAVIFSGTGPALFLGHLATCDAPGLFLLALAAWTAVRTAAFRWPAWLLAAPAAALAAADTYVSLLYVPTVAALAALAGWPHRRARALLPPAALTAVTGALLAVALRLAGPAYLRGIEVTAASPPGGNAPVRPLLWDCLRWGGVPFALAVAGAVCYARRAENEPGEQIAPPGGRWRRSLLGMVLTGTALMAPVWQIRVHSGTSLFSHIGFGLFFAAPLAGVGLARIIGDHFRRAQVGVAVWGAALVLGMMQATALSGAWPDSRQPVQQMSRYLRPGARYLVEEAEVPIYYLRRYPDAQPDQFTATSSISYATRQGQVLTGTAGYLSAIGDGYFRMIAYDGRVTPALDLALARALRASPRYRLAAAIPSGAGSVTCYIWVERDHPPRRR
jgi:4-amino-4-deoxy-L-arabinose transferase-like glycosyltransferase